MNKPTVNSYLIAGRRKLFWKFPNGDEMIEEYVKETHELISWLWKKKSGLKTDETVEIGLPT